MVPLRHPLPKHCHFCSINRTSFVVVLFRKLSNGSEIIANPISVKSKGEKTTVSIRPERALINPKGGMDNNHKGKIEEIIYHGDHTRVRLSLLGNSDFILKVPNSSENLDIKLGNTINIGWNSQDARALDPK